MPYRGIVVALVLVTRRTARHWWQRWRVLARCAVRSGE